MPPTIGTHRTDRLTLVPTTWRDAAFISTLLGSPSVRAHLGGPVPLRRRPAILRRYIAARPGRAIWTVRTDTPVGLVFLAGHADGSADLSYQFHPDAWGHGYAFEACAHLRDLALGPLGHSRLTAETQAANTRSRRLLERLGLRLTSHTTRFGAEQAIYST